MDYKKHYSRERVSNKEVNNQNKLLSLYNQVHGTTYTLDSVGIQKVVRTVSDSSYHGTPDKNFGFFKRNGVPYRKI